jgi:predicted PurR-regulated permease PerM
VRGGVLLEINKKAFRSLIGGVVLCIFVYWLLHETERVTAFLGGVVNLLSPFVIGAALAFILNVPMRSIERFLLQGVQKLSIRRAIAILLTIVIILLVIAVVVVLLGPQVDATVQSLVGELPAFFERTEIAVGEFLENNPEAMEWLNTNTDLENFDWMSIVQKIATIAGNSVTVILNSAISVFGSIVSAIVTAIIAIVFAIYSLSRKEVLARQGRRLLYSFLPERISDEIIRIMRLTNSTFSNFISGQCLEACILGCMFAIAMAIFGMPYIPLVSVLVAVTALVPLVGAFVGCIFGALFILVDSPLLALWFVVLFLVLQQIEGNLIYPKVVGTSIGLPGMWVLLAVTIGADTMGVGGMLVMIPLASVLYALLREFTDFRLKQLKIDPEKVKDQPPLLKSNFKEKRKQAKEKISVKKVKEANKEK